MGRKSKRKGVSSNPVEVDLELPPTGPEESRKNIEPVVRGQVDIQDQEPSSVSSNPPKVEGAIDKDNGQDGESIRPQEETLTSTAVKPSKKRNRWKRRPKKSSNFEGPGCLEGTQEESVDHDQSGGHGSKPKVSRVKGEVKETQKELESNDDSLEEGELEWLKEVREKITELKVAAVIDDKNDWTRNPAQAQAVVKEPSPSDHLHDMNNFINQAWASYQGQAKGHVSASTPESRLKALLESAINSSPSPMTSTSSSTTSKKDRGQSKSNPGSKKLTRSTHRPQGSGGGAGGKKAEPSSSPSTSGASGSFRGHQNPSSASISVRGPVQQLDLGFHEPDPGQRTNEDGMKSWLKGVDLDKGIEWLMNESFDEIDPLDKSN